MIKQIPINEAYAQLMKQLELDQKDWYEKVFLPNLEKAINGEPHDPALLEGTLKLNRETEQDNKDGDNNS